MFDPGLELDRLCSDTRAIEGLPIRLVVALVVGVASLSVMLNMISGLGGLAVNEVDTRPSPEVTASGSQTVAVRVVDSDGAGVANATVVARPDSAQLDGVHTARTGLDGTAEFRLTPELGPNQHEGTLAFDVKPPSGSEYVDRRENTALLVVRGG